MNVGVASLYSDAPFFFQLPGSDPRSINWAAIEDKVMFQFGYQIHWSPLLVDVFQLPVQLVCHFNSVMGATTPVKPMNVVKS